MGNATASPYVNKKWVACSNNKPVFTRATYT